VEDIFDFENNDFVLKTHFVARIFFEMRKTYLVTTFFAQKISCNGILRKRWGYLLPLCLSKTGAPV